MKFIKWLGCKMPLLEKISAIAPDFDLYVDPFFGTGSLYFNLFSKTAKHAVLSDRNKPLIGLFNTIKDYPEEFVHSLKKLEVEFNSYPDKRKYYNSVRDRYNANKYDIFTKSLHFVFISRTGFKGLYRENQSGKCNTPVGVDALKPAKYIKYIKIVWEEDILELSAMLRSLNYDLSYSDFTKVLSRDFPDNTFVYLDPPYHRNFINYTSTPFTEQYQRQLKEYCDRLDSDGVSFLQSNSDTPLMRSLYQNYQIIPVEVQRSIKSKKSSELLIKNYGSC